MKNGTLKSLKHITVVVIIGLISVFMLSCTGSSGGGDGDGADNAPQTYTATGTYTYNPDTGALAGNFTSSEFTGCGPEVGSFEINVNSISETTMVWDEGGDDETTLIRDSGTAGDIVGTWDFADEDGNDYELNVGDDGSIVLIGDIVVCLDDDGDDGNPGSGSGGATGTWSLSIVNDLDSRQTNTDCDIDATGTDTLNFVQNGSSFRFTTEEGNTFNGTVVGDLYSYTGMWEDEGVSYLATGTFTINSSLNSFTGPGVVTATQGTDFCIWNQTISGTKQ